MSQFECNVKDLIESNTTRENNEINVEPIEEEIENQVTIDQQIPRPQSQGKTNIPKRKITNNLKTPQRETVKTTVWEVILNDVKDKKNHKIFMVIIGMYLLLNSQPIYKLIYDMFPYLMESVTKVNIKGQIAIAIAISIAVIISKSSLV
tara:strand:+ start:2494 stop:2940 length:447 start_codon:yes stop_codon:yes gene_type:complete